MNTDKSEGASLKDGPIDWAAKFKGRRESIVVPPYIRFLGGSICLRKAVVFLRTAENVARAGDPRMSQAFQDLHDSKDSRQIDIDFETYFGALLTINLVSEVEHFLGGAVAAALRLFPEKMGSHTFKLSEIVSASSTEELIDRAAKSVLNNLMYEKPLDYVKSLASILSIDAKSIANEWLSYVELKARRDIGVHNNWVVNEIYLRKLREANIASELILEQRAIPDFKYSLQAIESCQVMIDKIVGLLSDKWITRSTEEGSTLDPPRGAL